MLFHTIQKEAWINRDFYLKYFFFNVNGLFLAQSLKKKKKLEADKTDEYYAFKTSEDSEDDDIFNGVVGHAVSAVVSTMTSESRIRRHKESSPQ